MKSVRHQSKKFSFYNTSKVSAADHFTTYGSIEDDPPTAAQSRVAFHHDQSHSTATPSPIPSTTNHATSTFQFSTEMFVWGSDECG